MSKSICIHLGFIGNVLEAEKLCSAEVVCWIISVSTVMNKISLGVSGALTYCSSDMAAILVAGIKTTRPNLYIIRLVFLETKKEVRSYALLKLCIEVSLS